MVSLTRRGWGYLGACIAIWLAWWLLGLADVRALAILVSSVVAIGILGGVLTRAVAQLSITLTSSDPTPSLGDDVVLTARLRHRLRWSLPLHVTWQLGEEKRSEDLVVSRGNGTVTQHRVSARHRGAMTVEISRLVVEGPLGLVRVRWRPRARQELLVLPPVLTELPGTLGANNASPGVARPELVLHGAGEPSGSVREYRDGDPMRHVHWKQSARQGSLLVNVPDDDTGGDGAVYLDLDTNAYPDAESFERAVATAATVGVRVLGRRENLRFQTGDVEARRVTSADELLRVLALVDVRSSESVESIESGEGLESRPDITDPFVRTRAGQAVVVTGKLTARLQALLDNSAAPDGTIYTCGSDDEKTAAAEASGGREGAEPATMRGGVTARGASSWHEVRVRAALMPTFPGRAGEGRAAVDSSRRRGPARRAPSHLTRTQLLVGAGILVALWLLSVHALTSVLEPGPWMQHARNLAVILLFIPAGLRAIWWRLRTSAVGVGCAAALATFIYSMGEIDRLSEWWRHPLEQLASVHLNIQSSDPPMAVAGATQDFVLIVVLLVITVSALLFVALDSFLVAGLVPFATFVVTPIVMSTSVGPLTLLASGVLLVILIWLGSSRRTQASFVAAMCALALAASMVHVFPAARDRVWNTQIVRSSLSADVPDLTVALGEDLRAQSNAVVFTYAGGQGLPIRFPLATLNDFSEGRWHPQEEPSSDDLTVRRSPYGVMPEKIDSELYGRENSVTITIAGLVSDWLPMPQNPYAVTNAHGSFDPSQWTWMRDSNTARSDEARTRRGDEYTVLTDSMVMQLYLEANDASNLQRMTLADDGVTLIPVEQTTHWYDDVSDAPEDIQPYLQLPEGVPESVVSTAKELTVGEDDPYFAASALAEYFTSGEFVYDESAPYEPGMDSGNPFEVMDALLQTKRGYCVHFASTFAVMARSVGIPSRVALGYASIGGAGSATEVRGRQLHAWPEIFIEDLGWVAFEPTPGGVGGGAAADAESDPEPSPEPSTTTAEPTPSPSMVTMDPTTEEMAPDTSVGDAGGSENGSGVLRWVGAIVLLLVVAGGPAGVRAYRSRRRAAMILAGDHPARMAWQEVVDTAVDLGLDTNGLRAFTLEAVYERLVASGLVRRDEAVAGAELILEKANVERYGAPTAEAESPDEKETVVRSKRHEEDGTHAALLAAVAAVVTEMRANVTGAARVTALVLPRSLLSHARRRLG